MTKKDFELIASIIASLKPDVACPPDYIAEVFADKLCHANPCFDRTRFFKACGVEAEE